MYPFYRYLCLILSNSILRRLQMNNIQDTAETLTQEVENAKDRARDYANDTLDKGQDFMDQARERNSAFWGDAKDYVSEHPGTSVGVALLVGTVAGLLIAFSSQRD